ncbi:hypothetical protein ColTof4_07269 [Colletotrichum tofieldiae]|nr:hypothetical protein ColTof4_07269 [Colletotrichum tofieldiae]
MSEEQWLAVANVAEQASRKRPNQNPQASFEKHLSVFRNIWWILFPEARFEPTSPFCEDIYCAHIGVLSDILFNERASSALGRDQPLSDPEYRATGAEVRLLDCGWSLAKPDGKDHNDRFIGEDNHNDGTARRAIRRPDDRGGPTSPNEGELQWREPTLLSESEAHQATTYGTASQEGNPLSLGLGEALLRGGQPPADAAVPEITGVPVHRAFEFPTAQANAAYPQAPALPGTVGLWEVEGLRRGSQDPGLPAPFFGTLLDAAPSWPAPRPLVGNPPHLTPEMRPDDDVTPDAVGITRRYGLDIDMEMALVWNDDEASAPLSMDNNPGSVLDPLEQWPRFDDAEA